MTRRSILERSTLRRGKVKRGFELQLTSMMDMLVILVVFMLKSYSASTSNLTASPNIKLPTSTTEELPADSANLIIEPTGILFENEKVASFTDQDHYELDQKTLSESGRKILPLFDAMVRAREKTENLMSKAVWKDPQGNVTSPPKFHGTIVIQADKSLKYDLLKKVMYTAGAAQFKVFKLATIKKET